MSVRLGCDHDHRGCVCGGGSGGGDDDEIRCQRSGFCRRDHGGNVSGGGGCGDGCGWFHRQSRGFGFALCRCGGLICCSGGARDAFRSCYRSRCKILCSVCSVGPSARLRSQGLLFHRHRDAASDVKIDAWCLKNVRPCHYTDGMALSSIPAKGIVSTYAQPGLMTHRSRDCGALGLDVFARVLADPHHSISHQALTWHGLFRYCHLRAMMTSIGVSRPLVSQLS